jgi:hypothetical protein
MGRLDYLAGMARLDPFHSDRSAQYVPCLLEYLDKANSLFAVTYKGMGRDIWTVPFDDITQMLRVRFAAIMWFHFYEKGD